MLRDEPKWNDKLLEIQQAANKGKDNQADSTDTATQSEHDISSMPPRPEGRDQAKKRKATRMGETSSSSVAVDMLKKMHDKGQEMDEIDAKHKEELISLERTKIELQQKQLEVQCDMQKESNKLKKEICQEKLQLQREMNQAKLKVQEKAVEVERQKNDTEIMFADLTKMRAGLRAWVLKRQRDIMIRDGVDPALAAATDDSP